MLQGSGPGEGEGVGGGAAGGGETGGSGTGGAGRQREGGHRYIEIVEAPADAMSFRWDFHDLADRVGQTLQEAEDALRLEQAVYGLDSLDEIKLHQLIVRGLSRWYMVQREAHYPSAVAKKRSQRSRCDMVITPKGRPLKTSEEPDLFTPPNPCPPEEALWLEIKSAYQYRDVATRHGGYGGQWKTGLVEDVKKLRGDERIYEAGLMLVVFNESQEVLAKDLELFDEHLEGQGLVGPRTGEVDGGLRGGLRSVVGVGGLGGVGADSAFRHVRSVRITERMGHRLATVALWPVVQRPRG